MSTTTIKSPLEWIAAQLIHLAHAVAWLGRALGHMVTTLGAPAPAVARIGLADLNQVLRQAVGDVAAYRSDIFFLLLLYPLLNLTLARVAFDMRLLPLLFPLASGFAILGPFTAIGLCEMSRRRELGLEVSWRNGFDVLDRPAIGAILVLGAILAAIFLAWLAVAWTIYREVMGPVRPTSLPAFIAEVLTTERGHAMMALGFGAGFLFALLAMSISVVAFPMLVDRDTGLDTAIRTSLRAVIANPLPMAGWGLTVAALLLIGSLPLFIGLIIVMPVLGHATWHLYRKLVPD